MNKTAKGSKTIRANKGKAKLKAKHRRRCCNHMTAAETKDSTTVLGAKRTASASSCCNRASPCCCAAHNRPSQAFASQRPISESARRPRNAPSGSDRQRSPWAKYCSACMRIASRTRRSSAIPASNIGRDIALIDLAQVVGVSRDHFIRSFRAATRRTPYAYVVDRRLARAVDALNSPTSIERIAREAGGCIFNPSPNVIPMERNRHGLEPTRDADRNHQQ